MHPGRRRWRCGGSAWRRREHRKGKSDRVGYAGGELTTSRSGAACTPQIMHEVEGPLHGRRVSPLRWVDGLLGSGAVSRQCLDAVKAEHGNKGANPRFVVTNLRAAPNRSVHFFDKQFRAQARGQSYALNPFEKVALPHVSGRVLDLGCGASSWPVLPHSARRCAQHDDHPRDAQPAHPGGAMPRRPALFEPCAQADGADEFLPVRHRINSSTRNSSDCGIVRPSAMAVSELDDPLIPHCDVPTPPQRPRVPPARDFGTGAPAQSSASPAARGSTSLRVTSADRGFHRPDSQRCAH